MATAQQFIALIRSHARGDEERFVSVVRTVVKDAEERGQAKVAAEMSALLDEVVAGAGPLRRSTDPVPFLRPRKDLADLVSVSMPEGRLSSMVLDDKLARRLEKIVKEQRHRGRLIEKNLEPRRKFLFTGPPGTGKTTGAAAIAAELSLPLFTVQIHALITKFMGETASKLKLVFDAMKERRAVYFFDEVDALAASRGADNDVGEARRIVNSFLQFLDDDASTSIVVAATNHPEILDRAFFRRFQASIEFTPPEPELIRPILENVLVEFDLEAVDWESVVTAAREMSQADLTLVADGAARDAVLDHNGTMTTALVLNAIDEIRR